MCCYCRAWGAVCGSARGQLWRKGWPATASLAAPLQVQKVWPLSAATFCSGTDNPTQRGRPPRSRVEPCRQCTVPLALQTQAQGPRAEHSVGAAFLAGCGEVTAAGGGGGHGPHRDPRPPRPHHAGPPREQFRVEPSWPHTCNGEEHQGALPSWYRWPSDFQIPALAVFKHRYQ